MLAGFFVLCCPSFSKVTGSGIFARMITIGQCLERMHAGEVFSLKVVSYDRRRRDKSGQVQEYAEGVLVWGDGGSDRTDRKPERAPTVLERALAGGDAEIDRRNPNHAHFYTRNIRVLQNGSPTEMIRKIHPPLIIEFNGETTCP